MAENDDDLMSGPLSARLVSTKGPVRMKAYEELATVFTQAEEDTASVFREHAEAIKSIIDEKNALAQERGMPAIVVWIDRSPLALSKAGSLATKLITKCLSGRPKTKQCTQDALLLYIERDQQDAILNALIQELKNKNPKISAAAVEMIKISLEQFGIKVISPKELLKVLPDLFESSDKKMREEVFGLTIELYKYIGPVAIKQQLQNIRSAQMKDLEQKFESVTAGSAQPKRFQRSFMKQLRENQFVHAEKEKEAELDTFDLLDAVNVLSKLPEEFHTNIQSKKWQERKEQVENLANIVNTPKILANDLTKVHKQLKKIIEKDTNVMIVAKAIECVGYFAVGLRNEYHSVSKDMFPLVIERLKEKKQFVLTAAHQSLDAIFQNCLNLSEVLEELCNTIITTKVVGIKLESIKFLVRLLKNPPKRLRGKPIVSKDELKALTKTLLTLMDDSVADIRTAAAECLGTLTGIAGERVMQPYFSKLDAVRLKKVQEFIPKQPILAPPMIDNSSITISLPLPSATKPTASKPTATVSKPTSAATKPSSTSGKPTASKPSGTASKAATGASSRTKPGAKPQASGAGGGREKPATTSVPKPAPIPEENVNSSFEYNRLALDTEPSDTLLEVIPESVIERLKDKEWQIRVETLKTIFDILEKISFNSESQMGEYSEEVVKQLLSRPGMKDSNANVICKIFEIFILLAEIDTKLSRSSVGEIIILSVDKLSEAKYKILIDRFLSRVCELPSITPRFVIDHLIKYTLSHKNPKVIVEGLLFIIKTLQEFGSSYVNRRQLLQQCKLLYAQTNPTIRSTTTQLVLLLRQYFGASVRDDLQDLKPQILQTLTKEFDKSLPKPPVPSRSVRKLTTSGTATPSATPTRPTTRQAPPAEEEIAPPSIRKPEPVVQSGVVGKDHFNKSITEELLEKFNDKDWKNRNTALVAVQSIIQKCSKSGGTSLPIHLPLLQALSEKLSDNNSNVVTAALSTLSLYINAVGLPITSKLNMFIMSLLNCLSDSAKKIVSSCLDTFQELMKYTRLKPLIPYFANSLENQIQARKELLSIINDSLPNEEPQLPFQELIKPILLCLQDRSPDIRKLSTQIIVELNNRNSYEILLSKIKELRSGVQNIVIPIIDKLPINKSLSAIPPSNSSKTTSNPAPESAAASEESEPPKKTAPTAQSRAIKESETKPTSKPAAVPAETGDDSKSVGNKTVKEWYAVLGSNDETRITLALKRISSNLEKGQIPLSEADNLITHLMSEMKRILTNTPLSPRLCRHILRSLQVLFSNKVFINAISSKPLKSATHEILMLLQNPRFSGHGEDGQFILAALYASLLHLLNNYERAELFCILTDLLHIAVRDHSDSPKYIDCLVKCLSKLAKTFQATLKLLDINKILRGLNDFFIKTPKIDSPSGEPHHTMRVIVGEIVRLLGNTVQYYLYQCFPAFQFDPKNISSSSSSSNSQFPVCIYALQFLQSQKNTILDIDTIKLHSAEAQYQFKSKSSGRDEKKSEKAKETAPQPEMAVPPAPSSDSDPPKSDLAEKQKLLEIFKNIRSSDLSTSEAAILDLFHFQKTHPTFDINPFLNRTSQVFRDHIRDRLATIPQSEAAEPASAAKLAADSSKKLRAPTPVTIEPKELPLPVTVEPTPKPIPLPVPTSQPAPAEPTVQPALPAPAKIEAFPTPLLPENAHPNLPVENSKLEQPVKRVNLSSEEEPELTSDDIAESYMEKLTRLRAKYATGKTGPSTTAQPLRSIPKPTPVTINDTTCTLNDIKKQLISVKASSPAKPSTRPILRPLVEPGSPAPSKSSIADLKNQLSIIKKTN